MDNNRYHFRMVRDKGGYEGAYTGPWDVRNGLSQPLFFFNYYYLDGEYHEVILHTIAVIRCPFQWSIQTLISCRIFLPVYY